MPCGGRPWPVVLSAWPLGGVSPPPRTGGGFGVPARVSLAGSLLRDPPGSPPWPLLVPAAGEFAPGFAGAMPPLLFEVALCEPTLALDVSVEPLPEDLLSAPLLIPEVLLELPPKPEVSPDVAPPGVVRAIDGPVDALAGTSANVSGPAATAVMRAAAARICVRYGWSRMSVVLVKRLSAWRTDTMSRLTILPSVSGTFTGG